MRGEEKGRGEFSKFYPIKLLRESGPKNRSKFERRIMKLWNVDVLQMYVEIITHSGQAVTAEA